ncbi:CLRN3 protein, partial [Polypterus senegalus]|nr:CLRN3 protein [Polypterus senegalus]
MKDIPTSRLIASDKVTTQTVKDRGQTQIKPSVEKESERPVLACKELLDMPMWKGSDNCVVIVSDKKGVRKATTSACRMLWLKWKLKGIQPSRYWGSPTHSTEVDWPFWQRRILLKVVNKGTTSGPLHALVVTFLAVSLFCSLCSFGTSAYNIFSNPYETYLGPIGVYVWSSISGVLLFFAIIFFVANAELNNLSLDVAKTSVNGLPGIEVKKNVFGYSYYILIVAVICNVVSVVVVSIYQHAKYTYTKEQQRPTENAPKEVMMY